MKTVKETKNTYVGIVEDREGSGRQFVRVEALGGSWAIDDNEDGIYEEGDEVIVRVPCKEDQFCEVVALVLPLKVKE